MSLNLEHLETEIRRLVDADAAGPLEWDSLTTLEVMAVMVDRFGLTPDPAVMTKTRTIDDLKAYAAQLAN